MTLADELAYTTLASLTSRIRRRELSPVEVVNGFIERISARNPAVNAFVCEDFERAHDEAVKAEGEVEPEEEARDLGEIEAEEAKVAGNEKSVEEQTIAPEGQKGADSDEIVKTETGDLEKPIPQNSKKASQ